MNETLLSPQQGATRRPWEEPAIVLERALEVRAQEVVPPGLEPLNPLGGFLGPLNGSSGSCP
jgi:hypothetical protein